MGTAYRLQWYNYNAAMGNNALPRQLSQPALMSSLQYFPSERATNSNEKTSDSG